LSQIKKHTWKGLAVVAAMLLSVGLMTQTVFAAATVTQQATGTIWVGTGTAPLTFEALQTNLIITESGPAQFATGAGGAITMTPPAGWIFGPAPSVTGTNGLAGGAVTAVGGASITITFTAVSTGSAGVLTVSNIQLQATGPGSAAGDIVKAAGGDTQIATGTVLGHVEPVNTKITITATPDATVSSDGTDTATLSFLVRGSTNNNLPSVVVNVTTSRGTLSVTSNTTSSSACATSAAGAACTLTLRGNGTTGSAQITATTASPNEAVATFTAQVGAPTTAATSIKHFSTNNSGHVAASTQNVYTSPTVGARVRFQALSSGTNGVNGELIQATVDKGYIVQGDTSGGTAGPGSCAGNNTTASDTTHGPVLIDGTDYNGIAEFTVCAAPGVVGPIKVTAKNLSTTMTDATTTLTSAGVPNKITATTSGGAVTATITDKDNNEVAEGTTVAFNVPAFTGTVAPQCTTTTNGKASAAAAFSGSGGQVLITVFVNDTGNAPASTCAALGSSAAVAQTINVGAGGGTTPGGGSGFIGTAPGPDGIALLVTAGATNATSLVSAFAAAGCTVESLAILEGGAWKIYINGAPAVVNSAFPTSLAATVAFFVRC
jgi:hypothetical protein